MGGRADDAAAAAAAGRPATDAGGTEPSTAAGNHRGRRALAARGAASWRSCAGGVAASACAIASVGLVCWQMGHGFDLTDESSYLQAVNPPAPGDAFNGLSGLYLRPLWLATGWNVAAVRGVGILLLLATAVLLGLSVARLLESSPSVVVAVTVAGACGFYASGVRTPSYNWLAVTGAALTSAAILRLSARGRPLWGALAGFGLAVSAAGKLTTALLMAIVLAVAVRRPRALGWAAMSLGLAVLVHLVAVLPATETVRTLRRAAAMLAAVDPPSYSATGAVTSFGVGLLAAVVGATVAGGVLGAATAGAVLPNPRQAAVFRGLCVAGVLGAAALALATSAWAGGIDSWTLDGGGALAVLVAVALSALVGRHLRLERAPAHREIRAAAVLSAAATACIAGSNVSLGSYLNTTTLLLAPACLLACRALPRTATTAVTAAVAASLCGGSLLVALEAHDRPKRSAPLAVATAPVGLGPVTVRIDAVTAAGLADLDAAATRAGWRPGTPLLDITFTPAVPLALRADIPPVLLPAFPGFGIHSACEAVRGAGPRWRDAWLLVRAGAESDLRTVASYLGRQYPADYAVVGVFDNRWAGLSTVLLRPRPEAGGASWVPSPPSCLGRQRG